MISSFLFFISNPKKQNDGIYTDPGLNQGFCLICKNNESAQIKFAKNANAKTDTQTDMQNTQTIKSNLPK